MVDMGLDCVYCLFKGADGEVAGGSFGDPGSMTNQFNKPAGITVDEMGSLIVVDSGNNRLQVVDSNWNICGALKVITKIFCSLFIILHTFNIFDSWNEKTSVKESESVNILKGISN